MVAFHVIEVSECRHRSTSSLAQVKVIIRDVHAVSSLPLSLFSNAPPPASSSEPFEITPGIDVLPVVFSPASHLSFSMITACSTTRKEVQKREMPIIAGEGKTAASSNRKTREMKIQMELDRRLLITLHDLV